MTGYLLGAALILLVGFALWAQARATSEGDLLPDRPDLPYRAYTTQFDIECDGVDLRAVLQASGNNVDPGKKFSKPADAERIAQYRSAYEVGRTEASRFSLTDLSDHAIVLLIDQSGSLADQMAIAAGQVRACTEFLEHAGARVSVAGFTTVGWRGGQSRMKWLSDGKPGYPGRLCDLLHVTYSQFENPIRDDDLKPLYALGAMFENVDGEALRWASDKLATIEAARKMIVVVSDGAPVDDSTLSANGPLILERDLQLAISELESDPVLDLGSVGIDFDVSRYYSKASSFGSANEVARRITEIVQGFAR